MSMEVTVSRNFKVKGNIVGMFAPNGGTPVSKLVPNLQVELWYKGPMLTTFLGGGRTDTNGDFILEFNTESPTVMIQDGKINDVFLKVYYGENILIGNIDPISGSFD